MKGQEDRGTRGPRDQRTRGPEDHGTGGPRDQRTAGPEDQETRGPRDQRTRDHGTTDHGTKDQETTGPRAWPKTFQNPTLAKPSDKKTHRILGVSKNGGTLFWGVLIIRIFAEVHALFAAHAMCTCLFSVFCS